MESAKFWPPLDNATVPSMSISPQCVAHWSISIPDTLNQPSTLMGGGAAKDCCQKIPRKVPSRDGAMEEIEWIHVDNSRG